MPFFFFTVIKYNQFGPTLKYENDPFDTGCGRRFLMLVVFVTLGSRSLILLLYNIYSWQKF